MRQEFVLHREHLGNWDKQRPRWRVNSADEPITAACSGTPQRVGHRFARSQRLKDMRFHLPRVLF